MIEMPSNPSMHIDSEESENNNIEELTNKLEIDNTKTVEQFDQSNIPAEVMQSPEVQEAAKAKMIECISNGALDDAIKIKRDFNIPDEVIQEVVKGEIIKCISDISPNRVFEIKRDLNIPDEVIQEVAKGEIIKCISNGTPNYVINIKKRLNISVEYMQSPEIQEVAKVKMIECISSGSLNDAIKIKDRLWIPDEFMKLPEIQEAAKGEIIKCISSGSLNDAIIIKDKLYIPNEVMQSPEVHEAAKRGIIKCISTEALGKAIKIKEKFNIPDEFMQSPEVHEAAKEKIIDYISRGKFNPAIEIIEKLNIPDEVIQSPEVQIAAKWELIECISNGTFKHAIETIEKLNIPDEIIQSPEVREAAKAKIVEFISCGSLSEAIEIKEKLSIPDNIFQESFDIFIDQTTKSNQYIKILQLTNEFKKFIPNEILKKTYTEVTEKEITDPQIKAQFEFFKKNIGENRLSDILINNSNFWNNIHDNLLFIQKLIELPEQQAEETSRLIFPLLNSATDFLTLNELLGYFSVEIYKEKNDGQLPPFVNFEHFAREAYLQRYNIEVPANASDNFRHALEHLISVRGVDVPFLRSLCETYSGNKVQSEDIDDDYDDNDGWSSYNDGNPEFAQQILDILEERDDIDERKLIKPFSATLSLDPLNKIVFNAIGFYSINNLTPKMTQYLNDPNGLGTVLALFESKDKETRKKIVEDRDSKISNDPDKKDRYIAEAKKQAELSTIVQHGSGSGNAESVNLRDIEDLQFRLGDEHVEIIKEGLNNAIYNSEDFRQICTRALTELTKRSESLDNVFDLNQFSDLVEAGNKLLKLGKDEINNIPPDQLASYFSGKEALLSVYLLWLSLNN